MKTHTALLIDDLPDTVITRHQVSVAYGYTIWRKSVNLNIDSLVKEVNKFRKLCELHRLEEVNDTLKAHMRLAAFMDEHHIDVIFTDYENEG